MGNLLGAPVTEKETHTGHTSDGYEYGVSSMQGWRVDMEDAHITETNLYALDCSIVNNCTEDTNINNQNNGVGTTSTAAAKYKQMELKNHSLFAVFDGHGGTFSAMYAGRNFCRVLSKQHSFVQYAKFVLERPMKEDTITDPTERLNYIQSGIQLLQDAFIQAFLEIDKEILCALRGSKVVDADTPYHPHPSDVPTDHHHPNHASSSTATTASTTNTTTNNNHGTNGAINGGASTEKSSQQQQQQQQQHSLEEEGDSGTTACVVMLTPEWVVCANAGDSRAVLSRLGNKAVPLSYDHKPDDINEKERIRLAGGYVAGGRVEGDLAVSRGLGDFRFKNIDVVMSVPFSNSSSSTEPPTTSPTKGKKGPLDGGIYDDDDEEEEQEEDANGTEAMTIEKTKYSTPPPHKMTPGEQKVSPVPDIIVQNRNVSQDEFIILACDGIWDVQTNYEAVRTVADMYQEGETDIGLICEEVCDVCLSMGSKDNMTALVIKLGAQTIGEGGGVMARRQLRELEK